MVGTDAESGSERQGPRAEPKRHPRTLLATSHTALCPSLGAGAAICPTAVAALLLGAGRHQGSVLALGRLGQSVRGRLHGRRQERAPGLSAPPGTARLCACWEASPCGKACWLCSYGME